MAVRSIAAPVALLAFSSLVGVIVLEIVGQNFVFTGSRAYFFADVDHRNAPYSTPEINGDGLRSLRRAEDFRARDVNLVMLGDSFVFGGDLAYEDTIPAQFEAIARQGNPGRAINVANFGWVSSSPLLALRLLRDVGAKYRPDVVLLAVDMTDIHDDIKYQQLLDRRGVFRLLSVTPSSVWLARKLVSLVPALDALHMRWFGFPRDKFLITARPLHETRPLYAPIRRNIEAIARFSRDELAARFVLFVLPRSYQYSDREAPESWERFEYEDLGPYVHEPFAYFEQMATAVDFPVHSLLETFQTTDVFPTCFRDDPHWNEAGAQLAARTMVTACSQSGCFD